MDLRYEPGDNKILHDEYFGKKPSVVYLLTVRLVLLCVMSCSFIMLFCDLYEYHGNRFIPALIAVGVSAVTYLLASLFPASIVYLTELGGLSLGVFLLRKKLIEQAGFFWDYFLLKMDSRLIDPSGFFIHDAVKLKNGYYPYEQAMNSAFGSAVILLAIMASIFFTASVRTRPHLSVPVIFATIITAPTIMAETAGFMPSMLVFVVCLFGFEAIHTSYELDNGFIYGNLSSAHMSQLHGDAQHRRLVRFAVLKKKVDIDTTHYHRYSSNLVAMALVAALVFFGAARLIPDGMGIKYEEVFEAIEDFGYKIADTFGSIFGTTFGEAEDKGYFSGETFGDATENISIDPPNSSDRPVIEVTLSRRDVPVYMRGDIGVDFVDGSWTGINSIDERYKASVDPDFYPETEYQVFRLALAAQGLSPENALPLQMVSTRYLRNTRVVFQPLAAYELTYRTNPQYDNFGDFVLRTKDTFIKSYECLSLTPTVTLPDFSIGGVSGTEKGLGLVGMSYDTPDGLVSGHSIPAAEMNNEAYLSNIERYREFIRSAYMNTDPITDRFTWDLIEYESGRNYEMPENNENTFAYVYSMLICDYFKDNFTYSLDAENGENQLEGFLYETHRGHCALFASAMTLALRGAGIPARYVTGYVAEGISKEVPDGYRYTLSERQLHAWVEVYFKGIGWLPFDPTAAVPGYAEVTEGKWDGKGEYEKPETTKSTDDDDPKETSSATTTTTVTTSAAGTDDTKDTTSGSSDTTLPVSGSGGGSGSEGSENEENKGPGFLELLLTRYLYIVITAAAIIVIAIILILFVNKLKKSEKKVLKSFRTLPAFEACTVMYRFILALLRKKGLEPGNEQFYDFAERVDSTTLLKDTNVFMMDIMPVFEKCEFGNAEISPVTDEEKEAVNRFTNALYKKVMSGFSPLKRFFVKISLFL